MADYHFFLSHAHVDRTAYLERFFADLALEVQRQAPLPSNRRPDDIGYLDSRALEVGDLWRAELVEGLQSARTFVAVLSPAYVNSESCGRELSVFLHRVRAGSDQAGPGRVVLPLMWEKPDRVDVPQTVGSLQWHNDDLGGTYRRYGLRYLAQRGANDPDYLQFVTEFAVTLKRAAAGSGLPRLNPVPQWETTVSAFARPEGPRAQNPAGAPPMARFAFVAGDRTEVGDLRTDVGAYAQEGRAWQPFAPSDVTMVGISSQIIAGREGFLYDTLDVDASLADQVRLAEGEGDVALIVIDPWTVQLQRYRDVLEALDQSRFVNYGILVPINVADPETSAQVQVLHDHVRRALPRTYVVNRAYVRDAIGTREDFERELITAIADARRRMSQLNDVRVWGGATSSIPTVSGPGVAP